MKPQTELFLNGNKKVTEADRKFIEKYIEPKMPSHALNPRNPFTGYSKQVNPLLGTLIYFTQDLVYNDFNKRSLSFWGVPAGQKIQLFDRARYIVQKLDSDLYMNILD